MPPFFLLSLPSFPPSPALVSPPLSKSEKDPGGPPLFSPPTTKHGSLQWNLLALEEKEEGVGEWGGGCGKISIRERSEGSRHPPKKCCLSRGLAAARVAK